MFEEHNKREKIVMDHLIEVTNDLKRIFIKNSDSQNYIIPPRMRLVGIFTVIDVAANYWALYMNKKIIGGDGKEKTLYTRDKFDDFVDTFCFCEGNDIYKKDKNYGKYKTFNFRILRDAIVHFYGLGQNIYIVIHDEYEKVKDSEEIGKNIENFKLKFPSYVYLRPIDFKDIVIEACKDMLHIFIENIGKAKTNNDIRDQHIAGIQRIYDKYETEGAANLPI